MAEATTSYRTGSSLGDILKGNEAADTQQPAQAVVDVTPTAVADNPVTATTPPTQSIDAPVSTTTPATPVVEPEPEKNVAQVDLSFLDPGAGVATQDAPPPPAQTSVLDWKEAIKKADKAEILKELGVTDFAIELNEHLSRGGKADDYLNAKAVDYSKISDDDIVKADMRAKFPTFSPQQIDLMFNRKYSAGADASGEDEQFAQLQLQAEAHTVRQQKIAEQQKFKIAEPIQVANTQADSEAEYQNQLAQSRNWFNSHEATQNLMTSKRVAIDLGDDGSFNYKVDRPEIITSALTDGELWARMTSVNPKESDVTKLVPDVAKLQRLIIAATNPNYEKDLVNFGKSLALPALVREGQNITQPAKVIPVDAQQKGVDWSSARTGKVGGGERQ
jgi:hypothetical protein